MPRFLVLAGLVLIALGLLWGPLTRLGLGRLPGDIVIERENFRLYIPITRALIVWVTVLALMTIAGWAA